MKEFTDKAAFIEKNGFYVSTPHGDSMKPFIRGERDTAVVTPLNGDPKRFDVILYRNDKGKDVMHRIVGIEKDGFLVRGDNCYYDEHIAAAQILGKVTALMRGGDKKKDLLKSGRYRAAVRLWVRLYPARRFFHRLKNAAGKLRRSNGKQK